MNFSIGWYNGDLEMALGILKLKPRQVYGDCVHLYMKSHVTNSWLQWLHRLHYRTPKVYQSLIQSIPLSSHQGATEQAINKCNHLYWQSNKKWGVSSLWQYFFFLIFPYQYNFLPFWQEEVVTSQRNFEIFKSLD